MDVEDAREAGLMVLVPTSYLPLIKQLEEAREENLKLRARITELEEELVAIQAIRYDW